MCVLVGLRDGSAMIDNDTLREMARAQEVFGGPEEEPSPNWYERRIQLLESQRRDDVATNKGLSRRIEELEQQLAREREATATMVEEAKAAEADRDNLRGMFESVTDELWLDLKDIDWCDWQEEAKKRGLIVTVTTTDPEFIAEWDSDQMLVYAWSDAAREEKIPPRCAHCDNNHEPACGERESDGGT